MNNEIKICPRCKGSKIQKEKYGFKCLECYHYWVECPKCGSSDTKILDIIHFPFDYKCVFCGHVWNVIGDKKNEQ